MVNSKIRLRFTGSCLKQDKATFTPNIVVNLYIVYELNILSQDLNTKFTLKDSLFGSGKITKNISKDFSVDSMKKTGWNRYVYDFSVGYNIIDTSNIIDIYCYKLSMCSKKNRRFNSKRVQHYYRNKWIENINKAYIMRM